MKCLLKFKKFLFLLLLILSIYSIYNCKRREKFQLQTQFSPASQISPDLTIIYSGNLDGNLEPCGCNPEAQLGGIQTQAAVIEQLRQTDPELVLISTGGLLSSNFGSDHLKSQFILPGMKLLKYDAIGVQWSDLAYGIPFLLKNPLPYVISNWQNDNFSSQKVIKREKHQISYFQWLDPKRQPSTGKGSHQYPLLNDLDILAQKIREAKSQGHFIILGTTAEYSDRITFLSMDVNILLLKSQPEFQKPVKEGNTLILTPEMWVKHMGRLDISLDSNMNITQWQHKIIPLPDTLTPPIYIKLWYQGYIDQIHDKNAKRRELRMQRRKLNMQRRNTSGLNFRPYIGQKKCAQCHQDIVTSWNKTKHAKAFNTLEGVNKSFDPDCLTCHTVAFEKPGGFIDQSLTPDLTDVQCESCHGPGRDHVNSKGKTQISITGNDSYQVCQQCHNQLHSPDFQLQQYKIHGVPCTQ